MDLSTINLEDILPQKHPFIMIDKIIDFHPNKSLTAVKRITGNEWIYGGQEPVSDIFPETLLIEAAAQAALILYKLSRLNRQSDFKHIITKIKANFLEPIRIGNSVEFIAFASKMMDELGYMNVSLIVNSNELMSMEFMYCNVNR